MTNITKKILSLGIIITISILFIGCVRDATTGFDKDSIYAQNLQYTKIAKIITDNEVEVLLNITYLNSTDSKEWNNGYQNFLVSKYFTDDTKIVKDSFTLSNQLATFSKVVNKTDKIYKNIALRNNWADYKIISFKSTDDLLKTISIQYNYNNESLVATTFTKE